MNAWESGATFAELITVNAGIPQDVYAPSTAEPVWVHNASRYSSCRRIWLDEAGNRTTKIAEEADVSRLAKRFPGRNMRVGEMAGGLEHDILMDGFFIEVGRNKSAARMLDQLQARQALHPDSIGIAIWSGIKGKVKAAGLNRASDFIGLHSDELDAFLDAII
jgi:hypothetical protein